MREDSGDGDERRSRRVATIRQDEVPGHRSVTVARLIDGAGVARYQRPDCRCAVRERANSARRHGAASGEHAGRHRDQTQRGACAEHHRPPPDREELSQLGHFGSPLFSFRLMKGVAATGRCWCCVSDGAAARSRPQAERRCRRASRTSSLAGGPGRRDPQPRWVASPQRWAGSPP